MAGKWRLRINCYGRSLVWGKVWGTGVIWEVGLKTTSNMTTRTDPHLNPCRPQEILRVLMAPPSRATDPRFSGYMYDGFELDANARGRIRPEGLTPRPRDLRQHEAKVGVIATYTSVGNVELWLLEPWTRK